MLCGVNSTEFNCHAFLEETMKNLIKNGINPKNYYMDHICYRTSSESEYEELKGILHQMNAKCLVESIIGGRLIATFKLKNPIVFLDSISNPVTPIERKIELIELPSPKPGRDYKSGYEHVEFVLSDCGLQEFMHRHSSLKWKTHGLEKTNNADIRLDFINTETKVETSVKFHLQSLENVIKEELMEQK